MKLRIALAVLGLAIVALYLINASWLAPTPDHALSFVAHRGVHQVHSVENLENDTCTASLIYPPTHGLIENTLPSIEAAFDAGAAIVEIDIHPTTDGEFAVFHDWTLECRTNGVGVTRQQTMVHLRTLDAGYSYTSDGGASYPLRGTGVGLIPTLGEVLTHFPERSFLINFKGGSAQEADLLSAYLLAGGFDLDHLRVYGAERPVRRMKELHPDMMGTGRRSMRQCASRYMLLGWSGHVPQSCSDTMIFLPRNYAKFAWGWPNRLQQRMDHVGSEVWIIGDHEAGQSYTRGVDDKDEVATLPESFRGRVWTNRIEIVAELDDAHDQ